MLGNARYKLGKPNINQVNLVESSLVRYTQFYRLYFKILPSKKKLGCHHYFEALKARSTDPDDAVTMTSLPISLIGKCAL